MEIPRGWGGLKGRIFRGVQGVPTRIIFHRVVKDAIKKMCLKMRTVNFKRYTVDYL